MPCFWAQALECRPLHQAGGEVVGPVARQDRPGTFKMVGDREDRGHIHPTEVTPVQRRKQFRSNACQDRRKKWTNSQRRLETLTFLSQQLLERVDKKVRTGNLSSASQPDLADPEGTLHTTAADTRPPQVHTPTSPRWTPLRVLTEARQISEH